MNEIPLTNLLLKMVFSLCVMLTSFVVYGDNAQKDILNCNKENIDGISIFATKAISDKIVNSFTDPADVLEKSCEMNLKAARGEYVSGRAILISSQDEPKKATVHISDLQAKKGLIKSENITPYIVRDWYQATGAWKLPGKSSFLPNRKYLVPELLVTDEDLIKVDHNKKINFLRAKIDNKNQYIDITKPYPQTKKSIDHFLPNYVVEMPKRMQPFTLRKEELKQLWFTFKIPESANPGDYSGDILVKFDNGKEVRLSINLEVYPFVLPKPALEYSIYYHGRLHPDKIPSVSSEYKTEEQLEQELIDMVEHGIENPVLYQSPFRDIDLLKRHLEIREKVGISNDSIYLIYLNTDNASNIRQLANLERKFLRIKETMSKFGVKNIYVYGIDEAKGEELASQKNAWRLIKRLGGKVFAAGYVGTFDIAGENLDILNLAYSPMPSEAKKFQSKNKKIFNYANPQVGAENPFVYRRNYGVLLWASGFDGAMPYAYQHFMGDGWNDFDHPIARDHNFVYSATNNIVGTIAWEGMREAIDDVRYITLLEYEIEKVSENVRSTPKMNKLVSSAKKYLSNMRTDIVRNNIPNKYSRDFQIDLEKMRLQIVQYILQIRNAARVDNGT